MSGKHRKPGTPKPECQYGLHYGTTKIIKTTGLTGASSTMWVCEACGGCIGVSSVQSYQPWAYQTFTGITMRANT